MVHAAPRYDARIVEALRALDDPAESMAEICRRVGTVTERLGLPRPSYVHLRRLLHRERERREAERRRREAIREIVFDVADDVILGLRVNAYEVAERVRDGGRARSP